MPSSKKQSISPITVPAREAGLQYQAGEVLRSRRWRGRRLPARDTRVLLNLISNGFTPRKRKAQANSDGDEPTLAAATKNLGDQIEIIIRETAPDSAGGEGEDFQPFFRQARGRRNWTRAFDQSRHHRQATFGAIAVETGPVSTPRSASSCRARLSLKLGGECEPRAWPKRHHRRSGPGGTRATRDCKRLEFEPHEQRTIWL